MNSNPTDLQAALRNAYEEAAMDLHSQNSLWLQKSADIIERHLTPVFEALVAAAYAACAKHLPPLPDATLVSCSCGAYFSSRVAWQAHIHSLTPTDAARELERRELEAERNGILQVCSALNAGEKNLGKWIDRAVYDIEDRLSKPAPVERKK